MMNPQSTSQPSEAPTSMNSKGCSNGPVLRLSQIRTEKARRSLKEFVVQAWPVLEPATPFVEGIHIDAICMHLQAVTEGRIANLIINVPPGHAKSLLVAVFWPAWSGFRIQKVGGCSPVTASHWRFETASSVAA
jgi:hypothetical protein